MSREHHQAYVPESPDAMQTAMGRGAQDAIIAEALQRIDGAAAPELDAMQTAMGSESQVRAAVEAVRAQRGAIAEDSRAS